MEKLQPSWEGTSPAITLIFEENNCFGLLVCPGLHPWNVARTDQKPQWSDDNYIFMLKKKTLLNVLIASIGLCWCPTTLAWARNAEDSPAP